MKKRLGDEADRRGHNQKKGPTERPKETCTIYRRCNVGRGGLLEARTFQESRVFRLPFKGREGTVGVVGVSLG